MRPVDRIWEAQSAKMRLRLFFGRCGGPPLAGLRAFGMGVPLRVPWSNGFGIRPAPAIVNEACSRSNRFPMIRPCGSIDGANTLSSDDPLSLPLGPSRSCQAHQQDADDSEDEEASDLKDLCRSRWASSEPCFELFNVQGHLLTGVSFTMSEDSSSAKVGHGESCRSSDPNPPDD